MENNSKNIILLSVTSNPNVYDIKFNEQIHGCVVMNVDGFYKIVITGSGMWEEHSFRRIADLVKELNRPYEEELKVYFDKQKSDFKNEENFEW
jgi:flavorubredoxin